MVLHSGPPNLSSCTVNDESAAKCFPDLQLKKCSCAAKASEMLPTIRAVRNKILCNVFLLITVHCFSTSFGKLVDIVQELIFFIVIVQHYCIICIGEYLALTENTLVNLF